jgi:hypothetical protein
MNLTHVPLLQIQRELQDMPRTSERFRQYLRTVLTDDRTDVKLVPLLAANPMARDHVTKLLDVLLAMDADGIAARTSADASKRLGDAPGDFLVGVVVVDDLMGGWTNRYDYEFTQRFGPRSRSDRSHLRLSERMQERLRTRPVWLAVPLWSSEPAPTPEMVRQGVLMAACRVAYLQRHGAATTLREMLIQEGEVMTFAGCTKPALDEEDIAYTREVLVPYLEETDWRVCMECLFGDAPGKTLGFTPRGLSPRAGLAVALYDGQKHGVRSVFSQETASRRKKGSGVESIQRS